MADFQQYLPMLLKFEGGFVNDPLDPGGITNKGVTLPVFKKNASRLLGVEGSVENLKKLSAEQAGKIYKVEYWDRILGDEIEFQPLANILCDFYVNAGSHAATLLYQVLNTSGSHHEPKGMIERDVIESLQHHSVESIYERYKAGRVAYYRTLVHQHPVLSRFLKGWLNRVNSFPDFVRE